MQATANKVLAFDIISTTGYTIGVCAEYSHESHWSVWLDCPETGETDHAWYVPGTGLEDVGPGPTPEDLAIINQKLGQMLLAA
jgi:hypothetical protein